MAIYTFAVYRGQATAKFTCVKCGKPGRQRKFKAEHTVNPFNKNADGSLKSAREVQADAGIVAKAERDEFMREPWCATCTGELSWSDQKALIARRRADLQLAGEK